MKTVAHLVLADSTVFIGDCLFETDQIITGEVVFHTAMCGYTEILTDPSFYGQIVVLSNPEVGNYGINFDDFQSSKVMVRALVVRNLSTCASSFRSQMTLRNLMIQEQVPVIFNLDSRALISHLRKNGAMMGAFSTGAKVSALFKKVKESKPMQGKRLSYLVSTKKSKLVRSQIIDIAGNKVAPKESAGFRVVVLDFGVKRAILRYLCHFGANLILVPSDTNAEEILRLDPDGLFLSNGPGDPKTEIIAVRTTKALLGKLPIFGVCLGHQILAQALGLNTYKLKFGHRGSNQAVKCIEGNIITTAQNHGFAIKKACGSLLEEINVSDGTNEGIDLKEIFAFSVQFHPEGSPGPNDAIFYFEKFINNIGLWKKSLSKNGYASAANKDAVSI